MFGEEVRIRRLRLAMTQEELAERSGLALRTIRDIETNRIGRPRPGTVRLLAEAFGLTGAERIDFHESALLATNRPPASGLVARPAPLEEGAGQLPVRFLVPHGEGTR